MLNSTILGTLKTINNLPKINKTPKMDYIILKDITRCILITGTVDQINEEMIHYSRSHWSAAKYSDLCYSVRSKFSPSDIGEIMATDWGCIIPGEKLDTDKKEIHAAFKLVGTNASII